MFHVIRPLVGGKPRIPRDYSKMPSQASDSIKAAGIELVVSIASLLICYQNHQYLRCRLPFNMPSLESPSDYNVPSDKLADLCTISLYELQSGSSSEQKQLLQTCVDDGFFYLDLTHPNFAPLLADVDAVFNLAKELFDYSPEVKSLFDVDKISDYKINGYKPKGRNVVGNGKRDGFESWVVSGPFSAVCPLEILMNA